MLKLRNSSKGDLIPGSLGCESGMLPPVLAIPELPSVSDVYL